MRHALETDRLLLRPVREQDAADAAEALNDFEVLKQTGTWGFPSDAEVCAARFRAAEAHDPKLDVIFAARLKADRRMIGTVGIHRQVDATYAVGYMIGRAWWGRGYMTEAVRAVCAFGFDTLRARRIEAVVFTDNLGSAAVLRKAGFRDTGDAGPGWSPTRGAHFPRLGFTLDPGELVR
ncbi:GNAT family N-acetyltransferase [Parvularcula oceani]|jgi:ribosomal-protein-alanine N-acetyltransferase|uniref:GNAT family N-acetyltransferase n=1 Tax=Parvularcula oceani TaxID=1247963 RepID=UPI00068CE733|nr:GNAT family N-acetyltransferase [Parvularcula oceani]